MSDFVRLKDIAKLTVGFVGTMASQYVSSGVPFLRSLNIKQFEIDASDMKFIGEQFNAKLSKSILKENDVIIVRTGVPGTCCVIPKEYEGCNCSDVVIVRPNTEQINPHYLAAYINFWGKDQVGNHKVGAVQQHFNVQSAEELLILLHKIEVQEKIAAILVGINKKIKTNKTINDNLMQMASTAFMHYFFERTPNGKLGSIIIEHPKSNIQVGEAQNSSGNVPFFTSGDSILKWDTVLVDDRCCYLNTGGNADVKFYVGKAAYSTDTWCISGTDQLSDYLYLFLYAIKPELDKKLFQGTGLKHLQKPLLKDRPIYIPTTQELNVFNAQIMPMMTKISENTRENQRLMSIRDWLLPLLMNGQATVEA